MPNVFDTTEDCSSAIQCLKQRGYDTVGRYYARPGNEWKIVKLPEAVALARAGMSIVAIYQDRQNQAVDFDLSKGRFVGTTAYNYAAGVIFQTSGSAIYFGVDYDASESEIRNNIIPFFQGVKESFDQAAGAHGPTFRIGVYVGPGLPPAQRRWSRRIDISLAVNRAPRASRLLELDAVEPLAEG